MKCSKCDCKKFECKNISFTPVTKGVKIEATAPMFICTNCKEPLMEDVAMNTLLKTSKEKNGSLLQETMKPDNQV
jgi:hypothetical protein